MTKKTLFRDSFVLIGAGLVGFASCTNEDENSVTPDEKGMIPVEIRSGISGGRTALSGTDVVFQNGDQLAVWDGVDDKAIRPFSTNEDGSVVKFTGEIKASATNLNILYPLESAVSCSDDGTITATIPTEQTATENTFDPKANLSVATATYTKGQNVTCTLENVCGVLKFKISEFTLDYDSIRIKAVSGTEAQDIAGTAEISASEKKITGIASGGGSKTITLKKKDDANKLLAGKTYYIVMSPQTSIDSLEMTFFQNDVIVGLPMNIAKTSKESFTVTPGVILNLGTVRPAPAFSVSATKKVIFAPGNLYCTKDGGTYTFGFEKYQYDFRTSDGNGSCQNGVYNTNGGTPANTSGLFQWYKEDAVPGGSYGAFNTILEPAGGPGDVIDWGNAYGGGWYTLSSDDWNYLINTRKINGATGAGNTNVCVTVSTGVGANKVPGLILFPDDYAGEKDGSKITTIPEGCVFLPIAGTRRQDGNIEHIGIVGHYWTKTASADNNKGAYTLCFGTIGGADIRNGGRYYGFSVRLVREVAATIPVSLTGGFSSGGISSGSFSNE